MSQEQMFVRKASGLVRAWSVTDAALYVFMGLAVIPLAFYSFSLAPLFPGGQLIPAVIISAFFVIFEIIVYASLIAIMPRAGGDYVWQSYIFGGWIGFVIPIVGWVLIQWFWAPVLGTNLNIMGITPLLVVLEGATNTGVYQSIIDFMITNEGVLIASIIILINAFVWVALGMKWYARMQKVSFACAILGLGIMFILLLSTDNAGFINTFNTMSAKWFGLEGDVYNQIIKIAAEGGYEATPLLPMSIRLSLPLIPVMAFYNLWANFGATLYGEVSGANSFRRNFIGMFSGLAGSTVLAVLTLLAFARTIGWEFFNAINYCYMTGTSPIPVFPFPGLLAAMITDSPFIQVIMILLMICWLFGWAANLFLTSSRAVFAAAFDRVLPEKLASVSRRFHVPTYCLLILGIGGLILSVCYIYIPGFAALTFDGTIGVIVMFLVTSIGATILPYKFRKLYESSPVAKFKVFGVPLITIGGIIFSLYCIYLLAMFVAVDAYGCNNLLSAIFVLFIYVLAVVIYAVSKYVRKKQGINLEIIHKTITIDDED